MYRILSKQNEQINITKHALRLWATCWWILPTARWRDASIDFSL